MADHLLTNGHPVAVSTPSPAIDIRNFSFFYNTFQALDGISLRISERRITALIGASGCGKSTLLRAINRMHDNTPGARGEGELLFDGENILQSRNLVDLRKRIGMIFQRSTAFPMSIYDNIAYGLRLASQRVPEKQIKASRRTGAADAGTVGRSEGQAAASGLALSGGQQQRLCIARASPSARSVLLMDEPCSALDPISTARSRRAPCGRCASGSPIVIVTHNMQQAMRVADYTAFLNMHPETHAGQLIEFGETQQVFNDPHDARTQAYISGKFG